MATWYWKSKNPDQDLANLKDIVLSLNTGSHKYATVPLDEWIAKCTIYRMGPPPTKTRDPQEQQQSKSQQRIYKIQSGSSDPVLFSPHSGIGQYFKICQVGENIFSTHVFSDSHSQSKTLVINGFEFLFGDFSFRIGKCSPSSNSPTVILDVSIPSVLSLGKDRCFDELEQALQLERFQAAKVSNFLLDTRITDADKRNEVFVDSARLIQVAHSLLSLSR